MIRDMKSYNEAVAAVKVAAAETTVISYAIEFHTGCHLYGGTRCYHVSEEGATMNKHGELVSYTYDNDISTISGSGCEIEDVIENISIDVMLKKIKNALKTAFSAPAFIPNDDECPVDDDDGMWENNHKKIPEALIIKINDNIVITVSFGR